MPHLFPDIPVCPEVICKLYGNRIEANRTRGGHSGAGTVLGVVRAVVPSRRARTRMIASRMSRKHPIVVRIKGRRRVPGLMHIDGRQSAFTVCLQTATRRDVPVPRKCTA